MPLSRKDSATFWTGAGAGQGGKPEGPTICASNCHRDYFAASLYVGCLQLQLCLANWPQKIPTKAKRFTGDANFCGSLSPTLRDGEEAPAVWPDSDDDVSPGS